MAVRVSTRGPFFSATAPLLMRRSIRNIVSNTIERGEELLNERLRPRPSGVFLAVGQARPGKASTGHYRRSVHGEVQRNTLGIISDSGVVYGPWLEGTSTRNQTTRFKGYASFRKVSQQLNREVEKIADKELRKLVGRLT